MDELLGGLLEYVGPGVAGVGFVLILLWRMGLIGSKYARSEAEGPAIKEGEGITRKIERFAKTDERLDGIDQRLRETMQLLREIKHVIDREDEEGVKLVYTRRSFQTTLEGLTNVLRDLISKLERLEREE